MHKHAHILPSKCLEMFSFKKFRAAIDVLTCLEAPHCNPWNLFSLSQLRRAGQKGECLTPNHGLFGVEKRLSIRFIWWLVVQYQAIVDMSFNLFVFFVLRNMYKHRNLFLCCCLLWGVWAWERGLTTIFSFFALQKSTLGLSRFVGWKGATVQQCRSRMCRLEPPLPAASHF